MTISYFSRCWISRLELSLALIFFSCLYVYTLNPNKPTTKMQLHKHLRVVYTSGGKIFLKKKPSNNSRQNVLDEAAETSHPARRPQHIMCLSTCPFVLNILHGKLNLQPPAFDRVTTEPTCSVTLQPQTMTLYQRADIQQPDAGFTSKNNLSCCVCICILRILKKQRVSLCKNFSHASI